MNMDILHEEVLSLRSELMLAREDNVQNGFEIMLLRLERNSAQSQLSCLWEELVSSLGELVTTKQCCLELSKDVATVEEGWWHVGLELFESHGALEELYQRHAAMRRIGSG